MSVIDEIYKNPQYMGACRKIAGEHADDLFQHVNIKILERERNGTFACRNLGTYYYQICRQEWISKSHSFRRIHFGKIDTMPIKGDKVDEEDQIHPFTGLDEFARLPSRTKSEKFVKEVFLECTKTGFKGIADLSHRTGINKRTIYGALYRYRELYNDNTERLDADENEH